MRHRGFVVFLLSLVAALAGLSDFLLPDSPAQADPSTRDEDERIHPICSHVERSETDGESIFVVLEAVGTTAPLHGSRMIEEAAILEAAFAPQVRDMVVRTTTSYFSGLEGRPRLCAESMSVLGLTEGESGTFLLARNGEIVFSAPRVVLRIADKRRLLTKHGARLASTGVDPAAAFHVGHDVPDLALVEVESGENVAASSLDVDYVVYFATACAPCSARKYRSSVEAVATQAAAHERDVAILHAASPDAEALEILELDRVRHYSVADAVSQMLAQERRTAPEFEATVYVISGATVVAACPLADASNVDLETLGGRL